MDKKRRKNMYLVRLWRKIHRYMEDWIRRHPGKAFRLGGVLVLLNFALLAGWIVTLAVLHGTDGRKEQLNTVQQASAPNVSVKTKEPTRTPLPSEAEKTPTLQEQSEKVYTFLQGPRSWSRRIDWSGKWGVTMYDGGSFGGFGCGLCCMANIYSTYSGYQASPIDVYRYAKKNTEYGGGGAIGWGYMKQTLTDFGFLCEMRKKPKTYQAFQRDVGKNGICQIVLVCSSDSTCYWKDTPGHYVTIFLYDEEKDKVFLADSGDPDHNRHWVSLKKIYRSLKTASDWQYMQVCSYEREKCIWKNKKTSGKWMKPDYI